VTLASPVAPRARPKEILTVYRHPDGHLIAGPPRGPSPVYIGALAVDGKHFDYRSNERLHKALELKLFEDQKDTIKLSSLVSSVIDRETQEKIDVVKARLIKNYGYNDVSATDVLNYVASIFARGDAVRNS
jgi:hypothetical protein